MLNVICSAMDDFYYIKNGKAEYLKLTPPVYNYTNVSCLDNLLLIQKSNILLIYIILDA